LIGTALALALTGGAKAEPKLWRPANLSTVMEVALATTSFIESMYGTPEKAQLSINVSDRNWVLTLRSFGNYESSYTIVGFLWGADKEDWLLSYSGVGTLAKERSVLNGKAVWKYDSKLNDHAAIDFDNIVKVGENSLWGWTKGAQIVVGGTIGLAGGIIATGMTPAGIVVGVAGAIAGADGAMRSIPIRGHRLCAQPAKKRRPAQQAVRTTCQKPFSPRQLLAKTARHISCDRHQIAANLGHLNVLFSRGCELLRASSSSVIIGISAPKPKPNVSNTQSLGSIAINRLRIKDQTMGGGSRKTLKRCDRASLPQRTTSLKIYISQSEKIALK
jgi:hypothetical protein